jgi:hypothetical protein
VLDLEPMADFVERVAQVKHLYEHLVAVDGTSNYVSIQLRSSAVKCLMDRRLCHVAYSGPSSSGIVVRGVIGVEDDPLSNNGVGMRLCVADKLPLY